MYLTNVSVSSASFTVNSHCAVFSLAVVTVIVAVPAATPFTFPEVLTVAMVLSEVLQVTVESVALSGVTVAFNVRVSPIVIEAVVLLNVTPVTATLAAFFTVILQEAFFPLALVAVMVAVPAFTPFTTPAEVTLAIVLSELLQVTVVSVALDGVTVAFKVTALPTFTLAVALFKETFLTATEDPFFK